MPSRLLAAVAGLVAYALALRTLAAAVSLVVGPVDPEAVLASPGLFLVAFAVFFTPLLVGVIALVRRAPAGAAGPRAAPAAPVDAPAGPAGSPLPALDAAHLLCAAGVTLLCAAPLEIAVDSAFAALTGQPCWVYRVWPVHHGYTSGVGLVMWPMYGAFVHALQATIRARADLAWLHGRPARAALVAIEAMVLEIAANAFALIGFGTFYFYYLPADLDHYTTLQILLPYWLAGLLGLGILDRVLQLPRPGWVGLGAWLAGAGLVFALGG